jgi:hypothetical protein
MVKHKEMNLSLSSVIFFSSIICPAFIKFIPIFVILFNFGASWSLGPNSKITFSIETLLSLKTFKCVLSDYWLPTFFCIYEFKLNSFKESSLLYFFLLIFTDFFLLTSVSVVFTIFLVTMLFLLLVLFIFSIFSSSQETAFFSVLFIFSWFYPLILLFNFSLKLFFKFLEISFCFLVILLSV